MLSFSTSRHLRSGSQSWACEPWPVARHDAVCLRQYSVVLESHRPASVSRCEFDVAAVRCCCWFDGGGSNAAGKYLFKHDLQAVANQTNITIRAAHYPSYCSKYHLIERRFFPHLSRACTGMLFDTPEHVVELMRKASTRTGLRTTVNVIRRVYETGRKATDVMKEVIRAIVQFADLLPKWNYTITPQILQ